MNSKKLIKKLWKMFPLKVAKKYHDYVGLMVSHLKEETTKVVICLDVSPRVIEIALDNQADLIISHHPFIYGKRKYVLQDEYKLRLYNTLEINSLPVYSFHTNFDESPNGMNDALASALELEDITPITNCEMGRKGRLKEAMDIEDFSRYCLDKFHLDYCQLINKGKKIIQVIGIIGGSGARSYQEAMNDGCDIFLSGDTPYHIRREVIDKHLNYLHIDHEVEKIFIPQMTKILKSIDNTLIVIPVDDVEQSKLIVK